MTFTKNVQYSVIIALLFSSIITSKAQDLHFSQFFAHPLTMNPAEAGHFNEDWRVSFIRRVQWTGIDADFNTTSLGADMNFKGGILGQDVVGVGLNVYSDNMGGGIIRNNVLLLSGSYHRSFGGSKRHLISFGAQGAYSQKSIDYSRMKFESQYEDIYYYNPDAASGENMSNESIINFKINLGLLYRYKLDNINSVQLALATFNTNSPNETFVGTTNDLGVRFLVELSANLRMSSRLTLMPHILYANQSRAKDFNPGAEVQYQILENVKLLGGLWYRTDDAFILLAGATYKRFEARVSYDNTISGLRDISGASNIDGSTRVNAWEVSLIIKGVLERAAPGMYTVPCRIF